MKFCILLPWFQCYTVLERREQYVRLQSSLKEENVMIRKALTKSSVMTIIVLYLLLSALFPAACRADSAGLTQEQRSALGMLNYIAVLTQEITASRYSRVAMEEAYSELVNNQAPEVVDNRTLDQLLSLMDTMESYRMNSVQFDRARYSFERARADILAENAGQLIVDLFDSEGDKLMIAEAVVMTGLRIADGLGDADFDYTRDLWKLSDQEAETLHASRKAAFRYMVEIVHEYDLPGNLALTEDLVSQYVTWENSGNLTGRIRFLESNRHLYEGYGGYWLLLAQSYYENKEYASCLEAMDNYEAMGLHIFRYDKPFARTLPVAVSAAENCLEGEERTERILHYVSCIQENISTTSDEDWALRYFCAITLCSLYRQTQQLSQVEEAYELTIDNLNLLVPRQWEMNQQYLSGAPVQMIIPKDAPSSEVRQIKSYNEKLKREWETQGPPAWMPVVRNLDLIRQIITEVDGFPEKQAGRENQLYDIIHPDGKILFLCDDLENWSWLWDRADEEQAEVDDISVTYDYDSDEIWITVPENHVCDASRIEVTVRNPDGEQHTFYTSIVREMNRGVKERYDDRTQLYQTKCTGTITYYMLGWQLEVAFGGRPIFQEGYRLDVRLYTYDTNIFIKDSTFTAREEEKPWYRKVFSKEGFWAFDRVYSPESMYRIGREANNHGDYETAVSWYQPAADQGNAQAQNALGVLYKFGQGVEESPEKAVELFQLAADQGYSEAQYNLGIMYHSGWGIEHSYEIAARYFQQAADQGYAAAWYYLGICYEYGQGVEQSYETAFTCYQQAAELGYASGWNMLRKMYENGNGVEQSDEMAQFYAAKYQEAN